MAFHGGIPKDSKKISGSYSSPTTTSLSHWKKPGMKEIVHVFLFPTHWSSPNASDIPAIIRSVLSPPPV
jgi:hypothetical protein